MNSRSAVLLGLSVMGAAVAQKIPDVRCRLEDYKIDSVIYWQAPFKVGDVQVVVLKDPAGEQEARFDLRHGATLVSLRYQGRELLYGQSAGAGVNLFVPRRGSEAELKGLSPYWSSYNPTQGGASMDSPATVTGVACHGQRSMRAFAMMADRAQNSSFRKEPLLALWKGKISDSQPPGYSTQFVIETNADWMENRGGSPKYYLRLEQSVVNARPEPTGPMEFFLEGAAPWDFQYSSTFPEKCNDKSPCTSANTPSLAAGRYEDEARQHGFAVVAPTAGWNTNRAYIRENSEFVVLVYGAVWAAPRHAFAAVLEHPLDGISAHRFPWYVCAGSWKQATTFAEALPR